MGEHLDKYCTTLLFSFSFFILFLFSFSHFSIYQIHHSDKTPLSTRTYKHSLSLSLLSLSTFLQPLSISHCFLYAISFKNPSIRNSPKSLPNLLSFLMLLGFCLFTPWFDSPCISQIRCSLKRWNLRWVLLFSSELSISYLLFNVYPYVAYSVVEICVERQCFVYGSRDQADCWPSDLNTDKLGMMDWWAT